MLLNIVPQLSFPLLSDQLLQRWKKYHFWKL